MLAAALATALPKPCFTLAEPQGEVAEWLKALAC
jgi:hypothetical protein